MSVTSPTDFTQQPFDFAQNVQPFDPQQGDLGRQHVLYPTQLPEPETPQQLIAAGWTPCPKCGQSWLSPENKAAVENAGGYYTCPKCKLTSDLLHNLPWHGVEEPDHYPGGAGGGGTAVGLPLDDVAQIAENLVQKMHAIPGYGPIVWWHPGRAASPEGQSALDGATAEWGIECKGTVYDAAGHFWDPRNGHDPMAPVRKADTAREMGLRGVLGVFVVENFRTDTADVYIKEFPAEGYVTTQGKQMPGVPAKWHKRTGVKVASNVPFENPYKDPNHPSPGPYALADYYEPPKPFDYKPPEPAPF